MSLNRSELTSPTPVWDFNAPQFVDFNKISAGFDDSLEDVEDYFNYDHEGQPREIFEEGGECQIPVDMQDSGSPSSKKSSMNGSENKQNVDLLSNLPEFTTGPANTNETQTQHIQNIQSALLVDHGLESSFSRSEAADVVASPSELRGRFRTVLTVNSARKRLSMSVDRGKDKMRHRKANSSVEKQVERKRMPSEKRYAEDATSALKHVRSHSRQLVFDETVEEDIIKAIVANVNDEVEEERKTAPKLVPHTGIPFKSLQSVKITEVKPFSFEKRDQQLMAKREEFVRKVLEDEKKARQFKAQPFPEILYSQKSIKQPSSLFSSTSTLNTINSKLTTNPFNLHTQMRAAARQLQQQGSINKQSNDKENVKSFKARPATVLQKNPFKPLKAHHHTTDQAAFSLSTQQRAEKRAEWEQYIRLKEQHREEEKMQADKRRMEMEMEETKKMRAQTVHKANPVPNFKSSSDVSTIYASAANKSCVSMDAAPTSGRSKDNETIKPPGSKKGCTPKNAGKPRPKSMAPLG